MGYTGKNTRDFLKVFSLAFLLLAGCASLSKIADSNNPCETQPEVAGASNLTVFLNIRRQEATPGIRLKFDSLELLVDDLWAPIGAGQVEVNSTSPIARQRFLGRQWLSGQYIRGVRMRGLSAGFLPGHGDRPLPVDAAASEIIFPNPVALEPGSRMVLLLDWDPGISLSSPDQSGTAITAYLGGSQRITANLAYVASPDLDTVYVVRTDKYQVVGAFPVPGRPTYLVADPEHKKIYVLAAGLKKIVPYDLATHQPGSEISIPLASTPIFMTADLRTQTAYVIDDQGVLTSLDLRSGNMLNRKRIGNRANYLHYLSGLEKLAVSSAFDQSVYLVDADTLAVEEQIPLGNVPLGLVSWGNYLYIAEGSANSVTLYDLTTRKIVKSIQVGYEPNRFATSDSAVYVTNSLGGSISLIQGGEYGVSKEIHIGNGAGEMAAVEKLRLLLIGEGDCDGSLLVVDTTGNQVIARIELGAKPLGLAVVE